MPDSQDYEPVISSKATGFLIGLSKQKQLALVDLIHRLAEHPSQLGDYSEQDDTGRDVQFLMIGDYVIGFWPDNPVKEFRIVDIDEV